MHQIKGRLTLFLILAVIGLNVPTADATTITECTTAQGTVLNNYCYIETPFASNYSAAVAFATGLGADFNLASIHSSQQNADIFSLITSGSDVWLGAVGACAVFGGPSCYANFPWGDGTAMDYQNWRTGEPATNSNVSGVVMRDEDGQWQTRNLNDSRHAIIAALITQPLPDTDGDGIPDVDDLCPTDPLNQCSPTSVPEPTTLILLSLGLFGLSFKRRKRR